ncbi:MAG: transcriptional regulator [Gammaproteobacteria bacterium]|nr:transcriptional regulator [Gammaproteobacteria bacterium]
MKVNSKIQKWGNGLAIRISGLVRDIPHFKEGMPVEIEISERGLKIRKLQSKARFLLPFSENFLLEGMTPQTAHADIITNPLKGEY